MSDFYETEESPITINAAFAMILNTHQMPTGLAGPLPLWMDVRPYFSNFVPRIPDTPYILDAHRMPPAGFFLLRGKDALLQIEASHPSPPPSGTSLIPVFGRKILPKHRNGPPFGNLIAHIPRAINPVPKERRRVSSARRLISKN